MKNLFRELKKNLGDENVKVGIFGAMMDIQLVNYGPVTVIVESKK
jgi:D-tyrosyl-tRNA(Tyr) deacylase